MENFQLQISALLDVPMATVEFCSEKIKVKKVPKGGILLNAGETCKDTFFVN